MINQISSKMYTQSFAASSLKGEGTNKAVEMNTADEFIKGVNKEAEKQKKGNFFSRYLGYTTAMFATVVPAIVYEFVTLFNIKNTKITPKTFIRNTGLLLSGGMALGAGLTYLFNSRTDKNFEKLKKEFEKINTSTDAKLSGTFRSNIAGAYCNSASGNIIINQNIMNDPIFSKSIKKLIRHELVHARQFEMIARSKDGIKKLNYATFANLKEIAKKNPAIKNEFIQIYNDVQNDKNGKYDNVKITINGEQYDFKKYIEFVNILLTKEEASYDDFPIIIDAEHYNKVIEKKGKLTPEEEVKAEEYFKALTNYTNVTFANAFNPFGGYRNNILEQEAYKENPSLFMRLFGKN